MMNGPVPFFNSFSDIVVPPTNYGFATLLSSQHLPNGNSPLQQMILPDVSMYASMLPYACSQELLSHINQPSRSQTEYRSEMPSSLTSAINLPQENGIDLSVNKSVKSESSGLAHQEESFWSILGRLPNIQRTSSTEKNYTESLNRRNAPIHSTPLAATTMTKLGQKRRKSGFQAGITVGYTYDAFFVSDGRSRKRKCAELSEGINVPSSSSSSESSECASRVSTPLQTSLPPRFTCSECGKHYATSSNLSRHKQTHRSLDSQLAKKCPHCGKLYVSMPALSMHILTHNLKHQCDICGKAFSRPWLLQGHRRAHTGEKPYGCAHCGRAFADRSNLRAHMQTHSSLRLHECTHCKKQFALRAYLNKHLETCGRNATSVPSSTITNTSDQSNPAEQKPILPLSIAALVGDC